MLRFHLERALGTNISSQIPEFALSLLVIKLVIETADTAF
jgi:hypothetical protein